MRILMHCHGGPSIGVGHVSRAASLTEVARQRGHRVDFSGTFEGWWVTSRLQSLDVAVVHDIDFATYDVVHVDTYLPDGDEVATRVGDRSLLSNLEDGDFGRRAADIVIDPTLGAERTHREDGPVLLRGSRWAPVRRSVSRRAGQAVVQAQASRVLVVMGGTDALGVTEEVLNLLSKTGRRLSVTAIVQRPVDAALSSRIAGLGVDVELVSPRPDLTELMLNHDLVVSAAGTSVWELCCLGVPTALVCASDNQRTGYERVLLRGAAVGLGSAVSGLDHVAAVGTLRTVLDSAELRAALARAAVGLLDGRGAWRVVRAWEELIAPEPGGRHPAPSLRLRPAVEGDAATLLRWRNDPAARTASRSGDEVVASEHAEWLSGALADPNRMLLMAADEAGDVGTVRWDRLRDGEWEVSLTVAPDRRGRSLSGPLLRSGETWLADHHPGAHTMLATVHQDNERSLHLFRAAGYLPDLPPDDDGFLRLVRQRVPSA